MSGGLSGLRGWEAVVKDGAGNCFGLVFAGGDGAPGPALHFMNMTNARGIHARFQRATAAIAVCLALAGLPAAVQGQFLYIPSFQDVDAVAADGTVSTFSASVTDGFGMALGTSGNLYVAGFSSQQVYQITPGGVSSSFASVPHSQLTGVAIDYFGNVYVASEGTNSVYKITPGGSVSTFATGFNGPWGLAFDSNRNLYVANSGNGTIAEVTPGGVVSIFASGFNYPQGLVFSTSGNLMVADYNSGTIQRVTPAGVASTFVSGFNDPQGVAYDASGNLYVSSINGGFQNILSKVTPGGSTSLFVPGSLGLGSIYFVASTFTAPVPEPADAAVALGAVALAAVWWRRRVAQARG
jgi:sugar lactone lactonase YvrE